eukprot:scaffold232469_cov20-Tisochrysis_lutea.AAC.2
MDSIVCFVHNRKCNKLAKPLPLAVPGDWQSNPMCTVCRLCMQIAQAPRGLQPQLSPPES